MQLVIPRSGYIPRFEPFSSLRIADKSEWFASLGISRPISINTITQSVRSILLLSAYQCMFQNFVIWYISQAALNCLPVPHSTCLQKKKNMYYPGHTFPFPRATGKRNSGPLVQGSILVSSLRFQRLVISCFKCSSRDKAEISYLLVLLGVRSSTVGYASWILLDELFPSNPLPIHYSLKLGWNVSPMRVQFIFKTEFPL